MSCDNEQLTKFQRLTQRFYTQLTIGCQDLKCRNKFCRKAVGTSVFMPATAKILALQLAANPQSSKLLCNYMSFENYQISGELFVETGNFLCNDRTGDFVHKVLSTDALGSLFQAPIKKSSSTKSFSSMFVSYDDLINQISYGEDEENIGLELKQLFSSVGGLVECFRGPDFKAKIKRLMQLIQNRKALYNGVSDGISVLLRKWSVSSGRWITSYQSDFRYTSPRLQKMQNNIIVVEKEAIHMTIEDLNNIFFVILLICETSLFETSDSVFVQWTTIVGSLNYSIESIFMQFIKENYYNDTGGFMRIVDVMKRKLGNSGFQSNRLDNVSLNCLNLFYIANEMDLFNKEKTKLISLNDDRSIIPNSEFYCGDFVKTLDLKDLYLRYLNRHSKSLLNYAFIFDVITKVKLLKIEALVRMNANFEYAMVKQGLVDQLSQFASNINELRNDDDLLISPVENLMQQLQAKSHHATNPYCLLEIDRADCFNQAFNLLRKKSSDLNKPLKVRFKGEEGLDQGGVQKELLQMLFEQILDPENGYFVADENTRLSWLNPNSQNPEWHFEIIGILLGLAAYNAIIINLTVPTMFFKKLLFEGMPGFCLELKDLHQHDPAMYEGLKKLLEWDIENGKIEDIFCQTFEVSYNNAERTIVTVPLCENGGDIIVNENNRSKYVSLYIEHMLIERVSRIFAPLQKGFKQVMITEVPSILELFRAEELKILLTGMEISDEAYSSEEYLKLKEMAAYNGYEASSETIVALWNVLLKGFTNEQRRKFLGFLTASDRIPIGGLSKLKLIIQRNGTADSNRLPTAYTCFNTLLLPDYQDQMKLLCLLSKAIEEGKGFGLV